MSIYLTAIVKSKPESNTALKLVLLNMVNLSRTEAACIRYELYENVLESTFIFQEEWADQEGLDMHNEQAYILDFVSKSNDLTTEILIYKTEKLV